jgi:hypothetical protein
MLSVRLNAAELDTVRKAARARDLTVSDFVRQALAAAVFEPKADVKPVRRHVASRWVRDCGSVSVGTPATVTIVSGAAPQSWTS